VSHGVPFWAIAKDRTYTHTHTHSPSRAYFSTDQHWYVSKRLYDHDTAWYNTTCSPAVKTIARAAPQRYISTWRRRACISRVRAIASLGSSNDILFIRLRTTRNKQGRIRLSISRASETGGRRSDRGFRIQGYYKRRRHAPPPYSGSLNRSPPYDAPRPALQHAR